MKLICVSNTSPDEDGRLKSLLKILERQFVVSLVMPNFNSGFLNLLLFCLKNSTLNFLRNFNSEYVLINNRKGILLFFLIMGPLLLKAKILYDMREFYELKEHNSFKNKIGTLIERSFICVVPCAIIVANHERKRLLRTIYPKKKIVVFENIRALSNQYTSVNSENAFLEFVQKEKINIIATDGVRDLRGLSEFVDTYVLGNKHVHFHICGSVSSKALNEKLKTLDNVTIYGKLSPSELCSLMDLMCIGLVTYSQLDRNNKYCASGKIYEFAFNRLPVCITNNPPLIKLVKKHGFGFKLSEYDKFDKNLKKKLDIYRAFAHKFSNDFSFSYYEEKIFLQFKNEELI